MKKRIISIGLLAALTISIGAMAGCGSSGSESSSEISSAYIAGEGIQYIPANDKEFDVALEEKLANADRAEMDKPVTIENSRFQINAFDLAVKIAYWIDEFKGDTGFETLDRTIAVPVIDERFIMIDNATLEFDGDGNVKEIRVYNTDGKMDTLYMVNIALYGLDKAIDFPDLTKSKEITFTKHNLYGTLFYENTAIEISASDNPVFFRATYTPMK